MAICGDLRQSTAATIRLGPYLDDTDGKTAETGLTVNQASVRLSKNGGAAAQVGENTTAAHDEQGFYNKLVNTTDTGTAGVLTVSSQISGALPIRQDYNILTANEWDRKYATTAPLEGSFDSGTAQAGGNTSLTQKAAAAYADDQLKGDVAFIRAGTGAGQARVITGNVSATDVVTVDPAWTTNPDNTSVYDLLPGYPAPTTSLPNVALNAAGLATDAANEIADAYLDRDMSTGTDSGSPTVRTPRQALRGIRNKSSITGTTLTVTKEDDTTASWTATVTGTPAVTAVDPA